MLPQDLPACHNIDVIHVKNVGKHHLSTILDVKDKTRDGVSAWEDLKKMKIMKELCLQESDGRTVKLKAPFILKA